MELKRYMFNFFGQEVIQEKDKQIDLKLPPVNSLDILNMVIIGQVVYIAAKDGKIYVFEETNLTKSFQPYNNSLLLIARSTYEGNGVLVTLGIDTDGPVRNCLVKFYPQDVLAGPANEISKPFAKALNSL